MLKEALSKIGLTEGEIEVYSALVELRLSTTGQIIKKANISSSKVYEVLQRLQQKGLASFVMKNGVRFYDATPPERLIDFLEDRKEELSLSQEKLKEVIPTINNMRKKVQKENQTIVYTGLQGAKIVLNEILDAGKRGISNYGFGSGNDPYMQYLPAALNDYIKEAKKYKFKTKLLFVSGFKSSNTTAQVRYLPKEYIFPVRTMIYEDKVAIIDFTKPITTIIIQNPKVAESYKRHFEMLWKIAKK